MTVRNIIQLFLFDFLQVFSEDCSGSRPSWSRLATYWYREGGSSSSGLLIMSIIMSQIKTIIFSAFLSFISFTPHRAEYFHLLNRCSFEILTTFSAFIFFGIFLSQTVEKSNFIFFIFHYCNFIYRMIYYFKIVLMMICIHRTTEFFWYCNEILKRTDIHIWCLFL